MSNKHYIECDCGYETLVIEHDTDTDMFYLCMMTRQFDSKSFWHRFRHIWHTLRYGTPYTDQMCMNRASVQRLRKWIENTSKHAPK